MIIRNRRENRSWLLRLLQNSNQTNAIELVLERPQFERELKKEIFRSDRRRSDKDLPLLLVSFPTKLDPADLSQAISEFRSRLRLTDVIGWYQSGLGILLPETNKEGALQVGNDLIAIGRDHGIELEMEISVYPWDDDLISLADELCDRNRDEDHPDDPPAGVAKDEFSTPNSHGDRELDPTDVASVRHKFVKSSPTPWWKRLVDISGSGAGLILLSPVFVVAAIAIKMTSKGPVFFRQLREGKDGNQFSILKFRTMVIDAEARQKELIDQSEQDGPAFKIKNDPRITAVGKYLRKSCIDELPQLINVLLGEMSLVGPRPLPVHESFACRAWQRARLTVLPGLTCTWQVNGGRQVKFADWMRMDLDYIERQSFWFDLKLIFQTAFVALLHRGSV